jgi:hypothetical protein
MEEGFSKSKNSGQKAECTKERDSSFAQISYKVLWGSRQQLIQLKP